MADISNEVAESINQAITYERQGNLQEALSSYTKGIEKGLILIKVTAEPNKMIVKGRISDYIARAEKIKAELEERQKKSFHKHLSISNDAKGYSYESIFKPYLDHSVQFVKLYDPYIRSYHQVINLLRFIEMMIKHCPNFHNCELTTTLDPKNSESQKEQLDKLKLNLADDNVCLQIIFSETLHDRSIHLSNGYIIKIGRGLDYFKPLKNKLSPGAFDADLRRCHETEVDIFFSPE